MITTIGIPTAIVIFLLGVLTGLIPTPLMINLTIIPDVQADVEGSARILKDIRYLNQVECLRQAETAAERSECSLPVQ